MIDYDRNILEFIKSCNDKGVEMMMVGGGAVNFHGYQRHSADIDFWINPIKSNLDKLVTALKEINIFIETLPLEVLNGEQNISIKISPITDIELITSFNPNKTFDEAIVTANRKTVHDVSFNVLSLDDLIVSKLKAGRYKDLLDVYELKRIHNLD